jgi:hypothetical protein
MGDEEDREPKLRGQLPEELTPFLMFATDHSHASLSWSHVRAQAAARTPVESICKCDADERE